MKVQIEDGGGLENKPEKSIREKYQSVADEEGYVSISEFCWAELSKQSKTIASFLDGDEGLSPEYDFGQGIDFLGSSGNYDRMKVHINDLETFIKRVKEHYGEK